MSQTVSTLPVPQRMIGNSREVQKECDLFKAKVADGTANRMDLLAFIMVIDSSDDDSVCSSEGTSWMHGNPEKVVGIVGNVDEFMDWILDLTKSEQEPAEFGSSWNDARYLRHWFLSSFLLSKELMALLSPAWRVKYVKEIYPRMGAWNNGWISAAVLGCVPREVIAVAILERLRRTRVHGNSVDEVYSFLHYGGANILYAPIHRALRSLGVEQSEIERLSAVDDYITFGFKEIEKRLLQGMVPQEVSYMGFPELTPWEVLNNHEFAEALMTCAEKLPGETLSILFDPRVMKRLNDTMRNSIAQYATKHMTTLSGVSVEKIEHVLNLKDREELARRLLKPATELEKPTAQFLLRITTELPKEQRKKFWVEVVEKILGNVHSNVVYPAWRQMKLVESNIETTLLGWVEHDGYGVGTIMEGPNPKGGTQRMVELAQHQFVQESHQHRYNPSIGDLVLFPMHGRFLTPRVTAVHFVPVMKEDK